MKRLTCLLTVLLASAASRPPDIPFASRLLDAGANESAAIADINGDGKRDIVAGENWFEAPDWKLHRFRDLPFSNNYIDGFADLPLDVDGDGRMDIATATWFGKKLSWYRNPGPAGGMWAETVFDNSGSIEFAFLVDLDNDGKAREILPQYGDNRVPLAWFSFANGKFEKHVASPRSFGHGIGAGDLNKDGKADILTPRGWLEAPNWTFHPDWNETQHLGFMHVLDLNGDGRADILTTAAHDYGIWWFEQMPDGTFVKRIIDDSWSQAHATTIVDLNGDGRPDLLTGKRYMAHNGKDPGEREPLGLYWYESRKTANNALEWTRHVIEYSTRAGGGMQLPVADIDSDGDLDFVAPGKSGLYLFENRTKVIAR